jgi:hypothetical protein
MPGINGNVYMFGNEIESGEDTSQALTKAEPSEVTGTEDEAGPNFTRPSAFPTGPGGGVMNVGTMVVVNQPSGTVNINASSPTAATFESRLRNKNTEPTPLSSMAEAAGLQIPPPASAKDLPLRMNFQGRMDTALPVKWPDLDPAPMRRKMFFGSKQKVRRSDAELPGSGPGSMQRPAGPLRSAGGDVGGPPRKPAASDDMEKSGAKGWFKSISDRFGKK